MDREDYSLTRFQASHLQSPPTAHETHLLSPADQYYSKVLQFHSIIQEAIQGKRLHLEWVTPPIYQEAWDIFKGYSDQAFSFVDCTSFVIARHAGVEEVFGFDQHFNTMGFILRP